MDEEINSKNITPEVIGGDFYDLDQLSPENIPEEEEYQPAPQIDPNADNALIDVIDVGLDFAEDLCRDLGYPQLKRKIWDEHGRTAMNKALNAYFPAGSGMGGGINQPVVCLIIGLGTLGICMYPVIAYKIKKNKEKAEAELIEQTENTEITEKPDIEIPETLKELQDVVV